MFPEIAEREVQEFLDGSARIALQAEPRFQKYILIEKDDNRFAELQNLKAEFSSDDIELIQSDANEYLMDLCGKNWIRHQRRAVLVLDPYGREVEWHTIAAIANTQGLIYGYSFRLVLHSIGYSKEMVMLTQLCDINLTGFSVLLIGMIHFTKLFQDQPCLVKKW